MRLCCPLQGSQLIQDCPKVWSHVRQGTPATLCKRSVQPRSTLGELQPVAVPANAVHDLPPVHASIWALPSVQLPHHDAKGVGVNGGRHLGAYLGTCSTYSKQCFGTTVQSTYTLESGKGVYGGRHLGAYLGTHIESTQQPSVLMTIDQVRFLKMHCLQHIMDSWSWSPWW